MVIYNLYNMNGKKGYKKSPTMKWNPNFIVEAMDARCKINRK
jgi:hypothetical protein